MIKRFQPFVFSILMRSVIRYRIYSLIPFKISRKITSSPLKVAIKVSWSIERPDMDNFEVTPRLYHFIMISVIVEDLNNILYIALALIAIENSNSWYLNQNRDSIIMPIYNIIIYKFYLTTKFLSRVETRPEIQNFFKILRKRPMIS